MNLRTKAGIVLVSVFLLGGVAGAAASRAMVLHQLRSTMDAPPSQARAHFRLEAMRRHLDLSDDQVKKLETILGAAETEREARMEPCRPALDELRTRTDAQILEVLTPDQRVRYQELPSRHGPFGGPPRPPGGPDGQSPPHP